MAQGRLLTLGSFGRSEAGCLHHGNPPGSQALVGQRTEQREDWVLVIAFAAEVAHKIPVESLGLSHGDLRRRVSRDAALQTGIHEAVELIREDTVVVVAAQKLEGLVISG